MSNLDLAFAEWKEAIGMAFVQTDAVHEATFATSQKTRGCLFPADSHEVQLCLQISNRFKIPTYPVSRGRNCGYGSKVPYQDGSVLLDLSRLDQITNYDPQMGTVVVGPGVTQEQLCVFLKEQGGLHWMDPVGTFEDCSVVGNILERGHGMTAYADRISFASDYEVILPTGRKITTGFTGFSNARTAGLDRWAPGPQLDGLFSQSNLGVITQVTCWLMPAPACVSSIAFSVTSNTQLGQLIDQLRPLRLDGTLRFGPRFFNEHRLIQTFSRYPWERMQGQTPLSSTLVEELKNQLGIPLWTGLLGFYGSTARIKADQEPALKILAQFAEDITLIDAATIQAEKRTAFLNFANASFAAMSGQVLPVTQRPRWRKRKTAPLSKDWSLTGCGIIWCPVSAPFKGHDTLEAIEIYRQTVGAFGFEPDMSISAIRDRTLEINASIIFDREDSAQDEAALACSKALLERLAKDGFHPHRLGLATMGQIENYPEDFRQTLQDISLALDPQQILAQGRYLR